MAKTRRASSRAVKRAEGDPLLKVQMPLNAVESPRKDPSSWSWQKAAFWGCWLDKWTRNHRLTHWSVPAEYFCRTGDTRISSRQRKDDPELPLSTTFIQSKSEREREEYPPQFGTCDTYELTFCPAFNNSSDIVAAFLLRCCVLLADS